MPNITDFDAGNLAIHPSETGVESFAAAGRRAGAFYNQAAESTARLGAEIGQDVRLAGDAAVNYMDHQQINAGADHASKMWADLQDSWNQTSANADPHDPSVAKKWREEILQPTLDQFSQGFSTEKSQNWANERVNTLRQHFFTTTEADMSRLAAVSVSNTVHNMANNYTTALFKDPTALSGVIDQIDHSIDGVLGANPNIKGPDAARVRLETGEKLKEAAVKAAAQGAILKGGDWQSIANKYPDYVDAGEMKMFERAARAQDRSNLANEKAIQLYNRQLAVEDGKTAVSKIVKDGVSVDDAGTPTVKPGYFPKLLELMAKNPEAAENAKTWFNWGEELNKRSDAAEKIKTDPGVMSTLGSRVLDADRPLTEQDTIKAETDAMQGRPGIAHQQGQQLRELIKLSNGVKDDAGFKIAMDGAKEIIQGGMGASGKTEQVGKFEAFMQQFLREYLKENRPSNALDLNDENSLIRKMIVPYAAVNSLGPIIKANGGVGAAPPAQSAPSKPAPTPAAPPPAPPMASM